MDDGAPKAARKTERAEKTAEIRSTGTAYPNAATSLARERQDTAPVVSVVIPALDHRDGLAQCLEALARQSLHADEFEIVVIDNGPAEGAVVRISEIEKALVGFPNAVVVREAVEGSYAARNLGVRVATSEILAFTDADCLPQTDWLRAGVEFLRSHREVEAAAGGVEIVTRSARHRSGVELYEVRHGFPQEKYVGAESFGATANLFVRRSAFEAIGLFDASLRSGGDREWGGRLRKHGLAISFAPDSVVRHPARTCLRELSEKISRTTGGDAILRRRDGWSLLTWLRYCCVPLRPPLRTIWRARLDPRIYSSGEVLRYGLAFTVARLLTAGYRVRRLSAWRQPL